LTVRIVGIKAWTDERGTTAVEFAIVGPIFIALVVGILYLGLCLLLVSSLHFAVEDAARCASVRTTVCTDPATTQSYAQSRYFGPGSPSFSGPTAAGCGQNLVQGSITYVAQLGLTQFTIPISASACYP
jgi:Flp pilus assembly protein TadG